jgi:hypothetical protein
VGNFAIKSACVVGGAIVIGLGIGALAILFPLPLASLQMSSGFTGICWGFAVVKGRR